MSDWKRCGEENPAFSPSVPAYGEEVKPSESDLGPLPDLREVFTTLDHLIRFGMIHTVQGVKHPGGSHQDFLNKAMKICDLLRERI